MIYNNFLIPPPVPYAQIRVYIDELIDFLREMKICAKSMSHLEDDYLRALEYIENYENDPSAVQNYKGRAALGGLLELYKWIWSVKECNEFPKLKEHLGLLVEASPRINSHVRMMNPITNKHDDQTNKFFEAIIGMWAVKVGENVELDNPIKSSGGDNPDVMFDYGGKRIAIACKTLRGNTERTIVDNLKSASKQIECAECDMGYVAINAMNILPHKKTRNNKFNDYLEPIEILSAEITRLFRKARENAEAEILNFFLGKKTRPVVLTIIHSVTKLNSQRGFISTSLKNTTVIDLEIPGSIVSSDIQLLELFNEFIHNRL